MPPPSSPLRPPSSGVLRRLGLSGEICWGALPVGLVGRQAVLEDGGSDIKTGRAADRCPQESGGSQRFLRSATQGVEFHGVFFFNPMKHSLSSRGSEILPSLYLNPISGRTWIEHGQI